MAESAEKKSFWQRAADVWAYIREPFVALKPSRIPFLLVFGGLLFLSIAAGQDVVRGLAERQTGDGYIPSHSRWFFVAMVVWLLSAWYWARVMLLLKFEGMPSPKPYLQHLRTWWPRFLLLLAGFGVANAFYSASRGFAPAEHEDVQGLLQFYGFSSVVVTIASFLFVLIRRPLSRGLYTVLGRKTAALNVMRSSQENFGATPFTQLSRLTRGVLGLTLALFAALFVVFAASPHYAAGAMGSAAIVFFAATGWIALGTTLDFVAVRGRVPVLLAALVLLVVCSLINDNHAVRTLDAQPSARADARKQLAAWLEWHKDELREAIRKPDGSVPLYLVDAEGGGIRAAYWTTEVLTEIQNKNPRFADHIFSISGVSGGSLGAAVFVALLEQKRDDPELDIKKAARKVLSEDFLSPVVGSMLFPDLLQRVWPRPIPSFDRATTLEESWENAWRKHVHGRARMSEPFDLLWDRKADHWTPALFLNATWVETGKRFITSNVDMRGTPDWTDFIDVEDGHAFFGARTVRLATAAHMSARFTYVSPAGTLAKDGKTYGRVVDGGYFENSGATATNEIVQTIDLLRNDKKSPWNRVKVYVIHISNDPVNPAYADDSLANAPNNPDVKSQELLSEALAPVRAMLRTRDARGHFARESLWWNAGWSYSFHFGLCRKSANAPLSWVLSQSTRDRMNAELNQPKCGTVFDNAENLKTIASHFPAEAQH